MDTTHGYQYQAFPSFGVSLSSSRLPSKCIGGFRIFPDRGLCTESGATEQHGQMPTRVASGLVVILNISHRSVGIEHSAHQCNADLPVGLGMEGRHVKQAHKQQHNKMIQRWLAPVVALSRPNPLSAFGTQAISSLGGQSTHSSWPYKQDVWWQNGLASCRRLPCCTLAAWLYS